MRPLASCLGCEALVVIGTYDRLPALCVPTEGERTGLESRIRATQPIGIGIGYHNCPKDRTHARRRAGQPHGGLLA
jgi:hypothetical protein